MTAGGGATPASALQLELKQEKKHDCTLCSERRSKYCNNIAESIDILEKYILKKPYFGFMLALEKELCNLNLLEDPISMQSYDTEIKRLKLCQNKYRKK